MMQSLMAMLRTAPDDAVTRDLAETMSPVVVVTPPEPIGLDNSAPRSREETNARTKRNNDILFERYLYYIDAQPHEDDNTRTSLRNLAWMCRMAIKQDGMHFHKAARWLGFVQGCLASRGIIDVDTEREFSRTLLWQSEGVSESLQRDT